MRNAHMYYVPLGSIEQRGQMIAHLKRAGISAVFHHVPLHSAPAGLRFSRSDGAMTQTDDLSGRLLRLPLWIGLETGPVAAALAAALGD